MPQYPPEASDAFQQRQALIAAATGGDADAQFHLGEICRLGDELTPQNYAEAVRWYRLAAEQGHAGAQNDLGSAYCNGVGVATDFEEAARWYRTAAEQGSAEAQFNLAVRYLLGQGVERDEQEAVKWFGKAAAQNYVEAIGELGTRYWKGQGIERNLPMAAKLHVAAALAGDEVSRNELFYYHIDLGEEALRGNLLAALCLAKMYDRGLGVEENKARAFAWLMWGPYKGGLDDGSGVWEELLAMRNEYAAALPEAVKDEAWRLFGRMWSPTATDMDNRPRDADGKLIDDDYPSTRREG